MDLDDYIIAVFYVLDEAVPQVMGGENWRSKMSTRTTGLALVCRRR